MEKRVFTQREAVKAYRALERIEDQELGWETSYWICKLKKKLGGQMDFQLECETKLFEKYNPVQDENGRLQLKDNETARAFDREWDEIGKIQLTDLKFKKVIMPKQPYRISPKDMAALDGFVEFPEPDMPEEEKEPEPEAAGEPEIRIVEENEDAE